MQVCHLRDACPDHGFDGLHSVLGPNHSQSSLAQCRLKGWVEAVDPNTPVNHPDREVNLMPNFTGVGVDEATGSSVDSTAGFVEETLSRIQEEQKIEWQFPGRLDQGGRHSGFSGKDFSGDAHIQPAEQLVLESVGGMDNAMQRTVLVIRQRDGGAKCLWFFCRPLYRRNPSTGS